MKLLKSLLVLCALLPFQAHAESKEYTYDKEHCDFKMTFPEQPVLSERCDAGKLNCVELVTYNFAVDLESAISVRMTCKKSTKEKYDLINILDLKAMAEKLATDAGTVPYSLNSDGEKLFKNSVVVAFEPKGERERMFIGQYWLSHNSMMTVEIENSGKKNKDADKLMAKLLSSLRPKDHIQSIQPEPQKEAPKEAPKKETKAQGTKDAHTESGNK